MNSIEYLHRNGVILERHRLSNNPITRIDQCIIESGRYQARKALRADGMTDENQIRRFINDEEMRGERDKQLVLRPLFVKVVFDYYQDGFEGFEPLAEYRILISNHPALAEGSHVGGDQLLEAGQKIPRTPTYKKWVQYGCTRYTGKLSMKSLLALFALALIMLMPQVSKAAVALDYQPYSNNGNNLDQDEVREQVEETLRQQKEQQESDDHFERSLEKTRENNDMLKNREEFLSGRYHK